MPYPQRESTFLFCLYRESISVCTPPGCHDNVADVVVNVLDDTLLCHVILPDSSTSLTGALMYDAGSRCTCTELNI